MDKQDCQPIDNGIDCLLNNYLQGLDGCVSGDLHRSIMSATESALIRLVLKKMSGNRSKVAQMLGISRNTLRKKIDDYNI